MSDGWAEASSMSPLSRRSTQLSCRCWSRFSFRDRSNVVSGCASMDELGWV